ncbi:MAG: D-glycerate dehydrogenase [Gemmatimonadaceae bacterium]|nr:D-glycerate dehydrogenase [Gemmatimonadaceae bacterium]
MSAPKRPLVGVTRRLPEPVEAALRERFEVRGPDTQRALDSGELLALLKECDALLPTVTDRLDAAVIGAAGPRCRLFANFGVGVNHIDLAAATNAGIIVTNTPDVLTDDTADLAMALMLATLRRLGEGERAVRAGRWDGWHPTQFLGRRLTGKTLGIVGLGRIGRAVAKRAEGGFGMKVLAWSRSKRRGSEAGTRIERVSKLDQLLEASDIVSIHCPLVPTTRHLIGRPQFARMKADAVLINTARGPVVDEAALVEALETEMIAGAGLDVYEDEPRVHPGLVGRENVVLLPHLGSATQEGRVAMGLRALDNLVAHFAGQEPPDKVN